MTAKLTDPGSSYAVESKLSSPSHRDLPSLELGKESLSPRTLDEREKRSLISYAETRYGEEGQFGPWTWWA